MKEGNVVPIDDQPVSSGFFNAGRWLTEYITPGNPDVVSLFNKLTTGLRDDRGKLEACWGWVASQVRYIPFIHAQLWVEGQVSNQNDFWMDPSLVARTQVGNCVNKSFLLESLIRNVLPADAAHVVMGNLNQNGNISGHAWIEVELDAQDYILESTRYDMHPFIIARTADIYEPVLYVNDQKVLAVVGRTAIKPFSAVFADWLKTYLDWAFIHGEK